MATETKTGRTVHAYRVASIPDNASPASWTPPTLAPPESPSRLVMRFTTKPKDSGQQSEARHYAPEQGMVLIPAGEFVMGDEEGARDEKPQRKVLLNAYWMDRYPVTNADYMIFLQATGHRRPPNWVGDIYPAGQEKHPVTNVSWEDAQAYAIWAGKRLPTEAECEKSARGTIGQTYPWGDAFRKDNVNSSNDYGGTTPVDHFEGGASPYGVLDMCGNVQEWCHDWYFDDYYKTAPVDNPTGPSGGQYKVVRGGFYAENRMGVRCAQRHYAPPEVMQDHIGFRCAKSPIRSGEKAPAPVAEPKIVKEAPKPNRVALSEESSLEDIARDWPENVAKVLRSILHDAKDENDEIQKVGIAMIGLGQTTGAGVLKFMTDEEITQIAQAVITCERVNPQEKNDVFAEIKGRVISGDYQMSGGLNFAKGTLEKALGPRKAHAILDRISSPESSGFYMLRNVDPNQIIPFISKEHPQTISLILSQLDAEQAAGVVNGLPAEMQADVAFRIAQMENISPRVLRELEDNLAQELQTILAGQITEIGGPKAVAEILNCTGRSTEKNVLERLDAQDPELAEEVRNQMFVFDDIANLTDREIQIILKEVDSRDLAVGLKGGSEKFQDRIFGNVSEEVGAKIKEEMQFSGPVRMSDVEEVQLRIVQTVRQLEEAGQVTIVRGNSKDKFV